MKSLVGLGLALLFMLGCSTAQTWDESVSLVKHPKDVAKFVSNQMVRSPHVKYFDVRNGRDAYNRGGGLCHQFEMATTAMCKEAGIDAWTIHIQPVNNYTFQGTLAHEYRPPHVATFGVLNEDGLCFMISNGDFIDFYGGYPWVKGWYASGVNYAEDLVEVYE